MVKLVLGKATNFKNLFHTENLDLEGSFFSKIFTHGSNFDPTRKKVNIAECGAH
jgi:hypothetical protein